MSINEKLTVTEIQRFCMHDGPGVRTTVFLKGCPLRCAWCHNPETQSFKAELMLYPNKCIRCGICADSCSQNAHASDDTHTIDRKKCILCSECVSSCPTGALEMCGKEMSVDEILSKAEKDLAFYGENGGITLSGGEPLAQGEKTISLLEVCKKKGLNTVIETCGQVDTDVLLKAIPLVDLFLWDIKDTEVDRHKKYTGVSGEKILKNLILADSNGAKTRLRCILVNGVNTSEEHYRSIAKIATSLSHCEGVEWIPYHAYGGTKATFLGCEDNGRAEWIPTEEQLKDAKFTVQSMGAAVL